MTIADDFLAYCPGLLFSADRAGTLLLFSDALGRLCGADVRQGARIHDIVHPADRHSFDVAWSRVDEGDASVRFEIRIKGADGAYHHVSCDVRRSPSGGERHGVFSEIDPDAARIALEARILRVFEDNVPIAVWLLDREGRFRYNGGKGGEAAGVQRGQLIGQSMFDLYGDDGTGPARQALSGEVVHSFTEAHGRAWENWNLPLRDAHGAVEGVAGYSLDLSEAKRAEREMHAQLQLIQRQQQVISSFATPIIEVWDKVLTLPMLGVVDSTRAASVMENLLGEVSRKGARFALLDLTGVEAVDTGTASHILKLIQALRLLGAEGIITGIQPNVAQTMVTLGVNLETVVTCANLRGGLRHCILQMRAAAPKPAAPPAAAPPPGAPKE